MSGREHMEFDGLVFVIMLRKILSQICQGDSKYKYEWC